MHFNKILPMFSLAVLSLGPINSLPVYAAGPLTSSSLCSKEDEEGSSCVPLTLSQDLSGEASKEEPSQVPIGGNHPLFNVFKTEELKNHIVGFLSPQDRGNLEVADAVFSNASRGLRVRKNFSFSMKNIQEKDADKFDLFLQRHSACKDLKISHLNWGFLSASLIRIKGQNPGFNFPRLETLDLKSNAIKPLILQEMEKTFFSMMSQLKSLNLADNAIEGIQHLAKSPHMKNLTSLNLHKNYIGPKGAQHLAISPHIKNITFLNLNENPIGDIGVQHLASTLNMEKLTSLDLCLTGTGDIGAQHLATSPYIRNLTYLNLFSSCIGDIGAQHLAASLNMQKLTSLDLRWNRIGSEGAQHLAKSPNLKNLTFLGLGANQIGPIGAQHLAESPHMKYLDSSVKDYVLMIINHH